MLLPPCLLITAVQQVETSSPPFQLKVLRVIDLDVHVLLHQQLLSSVMGQYGGLLAPSGSGGVFLTHAPLHPTPPLFLSVAVHSQALIPPSSFEYLHMYLNMYSNGEVPGEEMQDISIPGL